jgi:hypothetical protein
LVRNKVKEISGGDVQLRFHEPNALVPSLEVWDAVKNGAVDAGYTTPGYHAGKIPAVSYFTAVPFGPGASEYHGWMEYGGGQQLKDRIYGDYGLQALNCLTHAPETSGWFRKKITKVEELKGMKMRFFGLGAIRAGIMMAFTGGAGVVGAVAGKNATVGRNSKGQFTKLNPKFASKFRLGFGGRLGLGLMMMSMGEQVGNYIGGALGAPDAISEVIGDSLSAAAIGFMIAGPYGALILGMGALAVAGFKAIEDRKSVV